MIGILRFVGALIIISIVIGIVVGAVVLWKILVSDTREMASIMEKAYLDAIRLPGESDIDASYRESMEAIKRYEAQEKGLSVEPETEEDRHQEGLWKIMVDAEKDYKRAKILYFAYSCGTLVGSLIPIGFGLLLISMAEVIKYLRKTESTNGAIQNTQKGMGESETPA